MGGSYYVEYLTDQLARRAWGHIQKSKPRAAWPRRSKAGIPKMRIEEAAARTQGAHRRRSARPWWASTKFKLDEEESVDVLKVDNTEVRKKQIERNCTLARQPTMAKVTRA